MSNPVPATLYRIAAIAGCGSAAVLLLNAAKRAGLIPSSSFTQLIAPVAEILALARSRPSTSPSVAVPARSASSLRPERVRTRLAGRGEFVINLVFKELPGATVLHLRAGPLGVALTVAPCCS